MAAALRWGPSQEDEEEFFIAVYGNGMGAFALGRRARGEENSMGMEVAKRNLSLFIHFVGGKRQEIVEIPYWQYRD